MEKERKRKGDQSHRTLRVIDKERGSTHDIYSALSPDTHSVLRKRRCLNCVIAVRCFKVDRRSWGAELRGDFIGGWQMCTTVGHEWITVRLYITCGTCALYWPLQLLQFKLPENTEPQKTKKQLNKHKRINNKINLLICPSTRCVTKKFNKTLLEYFLSAAFTPNEEKTIKLYHHFVL